MTIQEFNATKWRAGMKVEVTKGLFAGKVFEVFSPNFDQQLIAVLYDPDNDPDDTVYFRCENCKLIEE